ncbi:MAG: LPS ABC transporter substrate-binding protein LptA [Rhizobiaceae bacterium]|nr:LPS ABC transporter substrate-binding protein LptA [Rhizobiaceae bacterium]
MRPTERRRGLAAIAAAAVLLAGAGGAMAQGQGALLSGDAPIEIVSDKLEVRDQENLAIFTGNVSLVQDTFLLRTIRMVVYYTSSGEGSLSSSNTQVDRIEAEGKVYVKSNEQVATGDYGTFEMATGLMVLTGKEVVLTEGDNVVVGCKLTMNMDSGASQVDGCGDDSGRVRMLLQPESQGN